MAATDTNGTPTRPKTPSVFTRIGVAFGLLAGLRAHDFRAAHSFTARTYPDESAPVRLLKFVGWTLGQMFVTIPNSMATTTFAPSVSRTSIWLAAENPLTNHPWASDPDARLPDEVEVAAIGAGFTGSACAYHWSKQTGGTMAVLEMNEASSGASGRNEGLVVMGRYYTFVKGTVLDHLDRIRRDLTADQRDKLASQFAAAYVRSAYRNGDLIERTVQEEGFDCDYARKGWVQSGEEKKLAELEESVRQGREAGFDDWTSIGPEEVLERGGMKTGWGAGFSKQTASWHPAKWVWSLLTTAIKSDNVRLYTNTRALRVEDEGERYAVHTARGTIRARYVINATESYSAMLHPQLRGRLHAIQTQAAFTEVAPATMKPYVGLQSGSACYGRVHEGAIFGSDGTRITNTNAGTNNPSRFITSFIIGEMQRFFGRSRVEVTREWSCTAGFTDDEFPIVGLLDGKRQYIVGGMCGSGSGVHFNGGPPRRPADTGLERSKRLPRGVLLADARSRSGEPPVAGHRGVGGIGRLRLLPAGG